MEEKLTELKKIIMNTKTLPTLPSVISKLNSLSDNDKSSVQEMARIVSSDQVLSARILRLANSPSYGYYRIATISNAMILLGINVVKSLAISSTILEIMEKNSMSLWEHSLGTGVASNMIAKKLGLPESEEIATAGLLHDIGKVIINSKCKEAESEIRRIMSEKQIYLLEAEHEVIGTNHAEVGGWLARNWFLPDKLTEPINCHHNVEASVHHRIKTSVVHLADVLVKASGFCYSADKYVPLIQQTAWGTLRLSMQIIDELVGDLAEKLVEVKNFSRELQQGCDAPPS